MTESNLSLPDIRTFAREKHDDQQRKFSNETYFDGHCDHVLSLLDEIGADPTLKAAGVTHDILEDTDVTYDQLKNRTNSAVADLVQEVTSDGEGVDKKGKTKYLADKMTEMSPEALTVKLADRLSNVSDLDKAPKHFRERYTRETSAIINRIRQQRELHDVHYELIERIIDNIRSFL